MVDLKMKQIVESEMAQHSIVVKRWSKSSCGRAYQNFEIKIPEPFNYDTLGVCFHEIGHVVLGHLDKNNKTRYVEEYEAEQFAIQKLEEYGYYDKKYKFRAIVHVLIKLAQAKNRGHNMRKVPKDVVKWTGIQVDKWNKARKVFVPNNSYRKRSDIRIYLYK